MGMASLPQRTFPGHLPGRCVPHCRTFSNMLCRASPAVKETGMNRLSSVIGGLRPLSLGIAVEGNIGVGKSTLLKYLVKHPALSRTSAVFPEPIDKWQNVNGQNMLKEFYLDPKRYAYLFQNYIFITRFLQHHEASRHADTDFRFLERCVFTDWKVFAQTTFQDGLMTPVEVAAYEAWFMPVVGVLPGLVPDAFLYLQASPEVCMERMKRRGRPEEATIGLDYLSRLHQQHEGWFMGGSHAWNEGGEQLLHASLADRARGGAGRGRSSPWGDAASSHHDDAASSSSAAISVHACRPEDGNAPLDAARLAGDVLGRNRESASVHGWSRETDALAGVGGSDTLVTWRVLDGPRSHSLLHGKPVIVVNCDKHADLEDNSKCPHMGNLVDQIATSVLSLNAILGAGQSRAMEDVLAG